MRSIHQGGTECLGVGVCLRVITGSQVGRVRLGGASEGWRHRAAYKDIIDFLSNGETLVLLGCNGSIH